MRLLMMKTSAKKKGLGNYQKKNIFFYFFFQGIKKPVQMCFKTFVQATIFLS